MNTDIKWETPPSDARSTRGRVACFVEALKEQPGKWARYPHTSKHPAFAAQNKARYPGTDWTARRLPDGSYGAWARWVGNGDSA